MFSSLSDPADLARAYATLDAVWDQVRKSIPESQRESERQKIANLIANRVPMALDEEQLKRQLLLRYRPLAAA